jgi:HTH-type transcriptional regulator/antitoxin HigA
MSAVLKADKEYMALVTRCPLMPIHNGKHYDYCIALMNELYEDPLLLTKGQKDYLAVLGTLIHEYESKHFPALPKLRGRELLNALLELNNLSISQLADEIGEHRSTLSAFLHGRRDISKATALALSEHFSIPVEYLL